MLWVGVAVGVYIALYFLVPYLTRRTKYEIDDVILEIIRIPLLVIIVSYGAVSSLHLLDVPKEILQIIDRTYKIILILAVTYLVWKLIRDVIVFYGEAKAEETETDFDDMLIRILRVAGPIVIIITAGLAILSYLGVEIALFVTVLGALSFLLAFIFQEPLSNLFSGIYLFLDAPFSYGDLIVLGEGEDAKTYRVEKIGTRVTQLYDTSDHTMAFIPNNKLAGERIINITKPNVELRVRITVGVSYSSDPEKVEDLLLEIANAHPHILGPFDKKREAIEEEINRLTKEGKQEQEEVLRLRWELTRLELEYTARQEAERIGRKLYLLSRYAHSLEKDAYTEEEQTSLKEKVDLILKDVAVWREHLTLWLPIVGCLSASYKLPLTQDRTITLEDLQEKIRSGRLVLIGEKDFQEEFYSGGTVACFQDFSQALKENEQATALLDTHQFEKISESWIKEFSFISAFDEYQRLYRTWHKNVRYLVKKLQEFKDFSRRRGVREFRLDTEIEELWRWFRDQFMLAVPAWQWPDVNFINFGESSLDFKLEFFVDDIMGENFERLDDVTTKIREKIIERFREEGIEIPFPQRDIWFRSPLKSKSLPKDDKHAES